MWPRATCGVPVPPTDAEVQAHQARFLQRAGLAAPEADHAAARLTTL